MEIVFLKDIIENDDIDLDWFFWYFIIWDILKVSSLLILKYFIVYFLGRFNYNKKKILIYVYNFLFDW